MSRSVLAAAALVLAVLAFLAGWQFGPRTPGTSPPGADAGEGSADGALRALKAEQTRAAGLAERAREAEEKAVRLEAELAALRGGAPGTPGGGAPAPSAAKGPFLTLPGLEQALADFDWAAGGEAVKNIVPLLVELLSAVQAGRPIPPSVGDIQRWNGPLVKQGLKLVENQVPGSGINGSFTHPAVTANLVAATLAEAGKPLTEAQLREVEELTRRYADEDRRRREGYAEGVVELRKVYEEAELKERYYADLDRALTEEQRDVLHPAAVRGRMQADLFSSGILWGQFVRPVEYADRASLEREFVRTARNNLPFAEDEVPVLTDLATRWVASLPDEYLDEPADPLASMFMVPVDRVRTAARAQLTVLEDAIARLPAGSPMVERLRTVPVVLVPIRGK